MPTISGRIRTALIAVLFTVLLVGGFEPFFVRIFFVDRDALGQQLTAGPDLAAPGYADLLDQVRQRTPPGSKIALLFPVRQWSSGYEYAYYRGSWFLAGREVIPLVDPDDSVRLERLRDAEYIASWRVDAAVEEFEPVWRGANGVLLKRAAR